MIDSLAIYDLIAQVFHYTQEDFHWGDNAIIHGSIENLPTPEKLSAVFEDGDYFALIDIHDEDFAESGNTSLTKPSYEYTIILMRKGKGNIDITKTRCDMNDKFINGWFDFFAKTTRYGQTIRGQLAVTELEKDLPLIAVRFDGVITVITQTSIKRKVIND